MRTLIRAVFAALLLAAVAAPRARADAPRQMYYRGQLTASPTFTGAKNVTFTIYDAETGGSAVFAESQSVAVSSGVFTGLVGSATRGGIPDSALVAADRWLDVSVDGEPAAPRQKLGAAPYAMSVAGINVLGGNVGIGTSSPTARLEVRGGAINASDGFLWNGQSLDARYAPLSSTGTAVVNVAAGQVAPGSFQSGVYAFPGAGTIGIGTVTPGARLTIDYSAADDSWNTAAFHNGALGPNWSHIHYGRTGDWYIRSAASTGTVVLQDSGGNVGIGTSNPTAKLEVQGGAIKASGGLIVQTFAANDTTTPRPTDTGAVWLEQAGASLAAAGGIHLGTDTACNAGLEGTIHYNKTAKRVELCDGALWQPISVMQQITQQIVQQAQQQTPPTLSLTCTTVTQTATQEGWFGPWCPAGTTLTGGGITNSGPPPSSGGPPRPWTITSFPYVNAAWGSYAYQANDVAYAVCCKISVGQ